MKKVLVLWDDIQYGFLVKKAKLTGETLSEIVRTRLAPMIIGEEKEKKFFSFVGIIEGAPGDRTSENVDEALNEISRRENPYD